MSRVLVVDDATFVRKSIASVLEAAGHEVVAETGDGKEAVDAYKRHRPDVVVMDVLMPVMDGIAATREIVEMDPGSRVVICSAAAERQTVLDAMAAGALDYIAKPFDRGRLLEAVRRALESGTGEAGGGDRE